MFRNKFTLFLLVLFTTKIFSQTSDTLKYLLPEVSVYGESKKEFYIEMPLSINAIFIKDKISKEINFKDALSFSPGILIQERNGGPLTKIAIRGFGSRSNDAQTQGIKFLVDGFPETEPDGRTSLDIIDFSSIYKIEVIRTNSSSVFGANSGGLINIITTYDLKQPFAFVKSNFGSYGFRRTQINVGINSNKISAFYNFSNSNYDGWREHSNSYSTYMNLGLLSQFSEKAKLQINVSGVSSIYKFSGPLTLEQMNSNPQQANANYLARDERRHNKFLRISFNYFNQFATSKFNEHSISVGGFVNPKVIMRSQGNSYRDFNRYHLGAKIQYNFNHTFNKRIKNYFTLGADNQYQNGSILFYNLTAVHQRGTTLKQNKEEGGHNYGFYFQDEFIVNKLSFLLGGRLFNSEYLFNNFIEPETSGKKIFRNFAPSIGISYKLTSLNTVYFNYSMGIENPAYNEIDPPPYLISPIDFNILLSPSKSNNFELGTKGILAINNSFLSFLNYELVGYYIKTKDELVPFQTDGVSYYLSAGETERLGLELFGELNTKYGLAFSTVLTLSDNKFVDFKNQSENYNDKNIPGIPSRILNMKLTYHSPLNFSIDFMMENMSEIKIDNANKNQTDSYTLFNVDLNYTVKFNKFNLKLFFSVENIFDKKYVSSIFVNGSNGEFYEPGLPRNYFGGASIEYNF